MILFHLVESSVRKAVMSSYHCLCHVPQNKMATQSISIWKLVNWHCFCHNTKCVYAFTTESFPVTIVTVTPTVQV